jgi:hypothetical protein
MDVGVFIYSNLARPTTASYAITSSLYTGHDVILSTTPYSDEKEAEKHASSTGY